LLQAPHPQLPHAPQPLHCVSPKLFTLLAPASSSTHVHTPAQHPPRPHCPIPGGRHQACAREPRVRPWQTQSHPTTVELLHYDAECTFMLCATTEYMFFKAIECPAHSHVKKHSRSPNIAMR